MRPPASTHYSKDHFLNRIIIVGLFSGALITTLTWLKVPNQITTPLTWFSLSLIGLGSFLQLSQPGAPRPRRIMLLATLAAVSLVYLFPELFGPACGGMPRAFALNCEPECRVKECTKWVAGPSPECPKPGPGGGCCLSEITVCDPKCEPPPPPNQPPTITGTLSCGQWGGNGWCASNAILELVATEPQGKQVLISGTVAGTSFACPAGNGSASCSLPLPEGANTVNYLATSSTGLTASGSKAYKYDATQPQISGAVNGITGSNGWYISPVEVGASASDPLPGSGLAAFEYNLNGGGWGNYMGPLSLSDGVHSLSLRASDAAGNIVETSQAIQVDTVTPVLDLSAEGTAGTNGWYISMVKVSAAASDSGSGVNALEYDLDGAGWAPYSGLLELPDGTHNLSLRVIDNAGNVTAGTQTFMVDTLAPTIDLSLTGAEGANGWYTSTVQVSALASDAGSSPSGISGLSTLEVSVDGGSWEAYMTPLAFNDGLHTYQFRATDNAGNLTKTPLQQLKVDTIPPSIILPESWVLGNAAYFELQDEGSGLASIRLVIEDEDERYPKATWEDALSSYKFKGEINWDGRFKDGQLAPSGGEYYAWLKATDKAGNEGRQAGQIIVEDEIPPSDHLTGGLVTATEIIEPLALSEFPPLIAGEDPEFQPPAAGGAPAISFGGGNNGAAQPTSAQAGVASFSVGGQSTSPINNNPSNILWGATAAAAIGAFTAEIARRKQEEQAKAMERAARQESRANSNYRQKIKAKKTAQLEAVWAAERALAEQRKQAAINPRRTSKEETVEAEMRSYTSKTQELGEAYYQYMAQKAYEAYRAGEVAAQTKITQPKEEESWWTKTKTLVNEKVIQPVNSNIVQPYIKPAIAKTTETVVSVSVWANENVYQPYVRPALEDAKQKIVHDLAWVNENIYQPYIKPTVEKAIQAATVGITWVNENVYQPYIQPIVEKTVEKITDGITWANEKIYQPHIKPFLASINEKVYQPYLSPLVDKAKDVYANYDSWINQNFYQPFIQPIVSDIDQYIYQPYFKPLQDKATTWWDETWEKYGEWVHGALDAVGFIPGLGEIADGINGLIYLGEGRYLEATVSVLAMIPLVGDLSKGGKWSLKFGKEIVETALEETTEKLVKEVGQETLETVSEKIVREVGSEMIEKTAKEAVEEVAEVALREVGEELVENTIKVSAKEVAEKSIRGLSAEALEKTVKIVSENVAKSPASTISSIIEKNVSRRLTGTITQNTAKEVTQKTVQRAIGNTAGEVVALIRKYGSPAVEILDVVDLKAASKLLNNLDADIVEYVIKQGPEAVDALSHWPDDFLKKHGVELALRAKQDARALEAASKLVELLKNMDIRDAKELLSTIKVQGAINELDTGIVREAKELLDTIAYNSIQNSGDRIVLGKWVPGTLDDGFIGAARSDGALFYGTNPGLEKILANSKSINSDDLFWSVNNRVLEIADEQGLIIDYSFRGLPTDGKIFNEINAIKAIQSGIEKDIVEREFFKGEFPFRMKEVKVLIDHGYTVADDAVDLINKIIHWSKP